MIKLKTCVCGQPANAVCRKLCKKCRQNGINKEAYAMAKTRDPIRFFEKRRTTDEPFCEGEIRIGDYVKGQQGYIWGEKNGVLTMRIDGQYKVSYIEMSVYEYRLRGGTETQNSQGRVLFRALPAAVSATNQGGVK